LRGLGIAFCLALAVASLLTLAASGGVADALTRAAWQFHDFGSDGLSDRIKF
jgi:hypothetical protein